MKTYPNIAVIVAVLLFAFAPMNRADPVIQKIFPSVPAYMLQATVFVKAGNGHGSGVSVGQGLIITAAHVAFNDGDSKPRKDLQVQVSTLQHNGKAWVDAKVVAYDIARDIAVLKTDIEHQYKVEVGEEADLAEGDAVFAIGAPGAASVHTATLGYLAAKDNDGSHTGDMLLWQSSNAIWFGNSGGPLFNANSGKLMGIVVQVTGDGLRGWAPNACFFVSVDAIKSMINQASVPVPDKKNKHGKSK